MTVLWIRDRPVAKCDPLVSQVVQQDRLSRPMGDPALDKCERDWIENTQILCY